MSGIKVPLVGIGLEANAKIVFLGSEDFQSEVLMDRVRSLNLEHVSLTDREWLEISRRPTSVAAKEKMQLAYMRHWFFARKPDAGFFMKGFPATLLQAKVFDDWLAIRNEDLTAVVVQREFSGPVVEHYRSLGLLVKSGDLAST